MAQWSIPPYPPSRHDASFNPPVAHPSHTQYDFPTTENTITYRRQRRHSFQETRPTFNEPQVGFHQRPPRPAPPRPRSLERTPRRDEGSRSFFKEIARTTIDAINNGIADVSTTQRRTRLYLEDAPELSHWHSNKHGTSKAFAEINILPMTTLEAAQSLYSQHPRRRIGILNFASATSPGGGFLSGARAQEESIARSSTLYASLITKAAKPFYRLHAKDERSGFYTHSMIYSPDIYLFRDDNGGWLDPVRVDVLTSPAVNAGDVRKNLHRRPLAEVERAICDTMRERMGRILALFEKKGARQLVLGSFGTGVFKNDVYDMAKIWYELLRVPGAPFASSFDYVVFAIPDFSTRQQFALGMDPGMMNAGIGWTV
ncbi:hypothetical protein BDN70DRAFT_879208 [Pholiota conissans]|uniref:Microbial-type PARG catalytic domain-containing protein n=1 Tax=Pholiota conissans TaxID=109636 RepID=A0A9P5Z1D9_9AGAR|nr:hypothetical protein BDN70DRAFT_879208 [Pholiota conissans]